MSASRRTTRTGSPRSRAASHWWCPSRMCPSADTSRLLPLGFSAMAATFFGSNSPCVGLSSPGSTVAISCDTPRAFRKLTSAPLCSAAICGICERGMFRVPLSGLNEDQLRLIFSPSTGAGWAVASSSSPVASGMSPGSAPASFSTDSMRLTAAFLASSAAGASGSAGLGGPSMAVCRSVIACGSSGLANMPRLL